MDESRTTGMSNRENRYNLLSGYLNRWATVIVFSAIVALAVGALFLKSSDLAHMPVTIGVAALDSTRSHAALESFSAFCRSRGCGIIAWRYIAPGARAAGCDFYLVPALSAAGDIGTGRLECALLVAERPAHRYSRSGLIVRRGTRALPPEPRIIFSSPVSAAGFLAPYQALERAGVAFSRATIDFSGMPAREDRVVFGVMYGAYDVGGISLERLAALEAAGIVKPGEVEVLLEGEAVPELILVCEPSSYTAERKSFIRRLPRVHDRTPPALRRSLAAIGIAGLYGARDVDIERISSLEEMIPRHASQLSEPERTIDP